MPPRPRPARLWLKPAERGRAAAWIIKDGDARVATGCGQGQRREAEEALAAYVAEKYRPERDRARHPSQIAIADVVNVYATDVGPRLARPHELAQRLEQVLAYFDGKTLADLSGPACRAYVQARKSESLARRELEDLRAAIGHYRREGLLHAHVEIALPERAKRRERWLTRDEAAGLIRAAWRYREVQKGKETARRSRAHVARFILVGLYTGTRSAAICGAALTPAIGRGFVDLERGVFYRRGLGDRETRKRQPAVQMPDRLLAHLRRWARLGIAVDSVVEFDGRPVKSVRKAFARAAAEAGLAGVTPHVLRHTAASWAMQGGADLYKAADFLGMTVETLETVYGHLHPDHHRSVGLAIAGKARR